MNKINNYESLLFNMPAILDDCECWNKELNHEIAILMNGTSLEDCEWKERIRKANLDFFNIQSDTLIGDFLFLIINESATNTTRISLKYLYHMYLTQGYDAVTSYIQKRINEDKTIEGRFHMEEFFYDYEVAKHFHFLTLENIANVKENGIYRTIGDLALVLHIMIGSYPVPFYEFDSVKLWDIDKDIIIENALSNSMRLDSPRLYYHSVCVLDNSPFYSNEIIPDYNQICCDFMTKNPDLRDISSSLYLSTSNTDFGAIALFYPGVMEKLATLLNDDYYVFIEEYYEAIIIPKSNCTHQMITAHLEYAKEYTGTMEEPLSHYVYFYNASEKKLIVIDIPN